MSSSRQTGSATACPDQIRRIPLRRPQALTSALLSLLLLFIAVATTHAAYPPVLVIDSAASQGTVVSGTDAREYDYSGGVIVLAGACGGAVYSGANDSSLSLTGSWDGGLNVSTTTATVQVPQVILVTSGSADSYTMQDYEGDTYTPLCNSPIGTSGSCYVQAYNGIPTSYDIFNFYDPNDIWETSPGYRFQSGPRPVTIYVNISNGTPMWPPQDVFIYPDNIYVDGQQLNSSTFDDGIDDGYWSQATYTGTSGNTAAWLEAYVSSSGTTGNISGFIGNNFSFSDDWDPTTEPLINGME